MADQYQVNSPGVVAEDVDGEVIVINMSTGVYYSMLGWSAWLWNCVVAGNSLETIGAVVPDPSTLAPFLTQLETDRLVVPRSDAADTALLPAPDLDFEGFTVERYTDMEDLILLDPVHDVDAAQGWPRAATDAE